MKLTVKKRLILITGVVLVGLAVLAANFNNQLNLVFKTASYASINTVPSFKMFTQIVDDIGKLRSDILFSLIDIDSANMASVENNINLAKLKLDKDINHYTTDGCLGISCLSNDEEQKLFNTLKDNIASLEVPRLKVMSYARQNKIKDAELVVKQELIPALNKIDSAMQAEVDFNVKLSNTTRAEAEVTQHQAITITLLITSVVASVICAFCYFFGRNLMSQLGAEPSDLAKLTSNFADGDLNQKITIAEGDKTSVAYSIKVLQRTLDSIVQSLNYVSIQHEAGDIDVSRFKGGYADVADGINRMVASYLNMSKKVLACVKRFGGDLNAKIEQFPRKKAFVNEVIEQVRTNINALLMMLAY